MQKEEKIELISESIKQNRYPLEYHWNNAYSGGNCYSYAIGSNYKESRCENEYIYNLGCISNSPPPECIKDAERAFMNDMKVLGVKVKRSYLEEEVKQGEWKVVLFYDDYYVCSHDFHLARQNADGNWSHKEFIDGPVRLIGANPRYCTDLTLVAYYMLKVEH